MEAILTSEKQRQQAREAIMAVIRGHWSPPSTQWADEVTDEILNLTYPNGQPMIGILDENQEIPEVKIEQFTNPIHPHLVGVDMQNFIEGMKFLCERGWRKTLE